MRQINRLSARTVLSISTPGRHADGNGLYLVVDRGGAKRWVFLFRKAGKLREMGLGGVAVVPLARARELAIQSRQQLAEGTDPIANRRAAASETAALKTFGGVADDLIASLRPSWKNPKHAAQWEMTLRVYAAPLRDMPVNSIVTENILAVLSPIWHETPETASRLRGRLEAVLDAAKARGLRTGENPARWRGHLDQLLPAPLKLVRGHHAAMGFNDMPRFIARLRAMGGVGAMALEFLILTAARSREVREAHWTEVDIAEKLWTIPADHMKAGKVHRVPLSARAVALLTVVETIRASSADDALIFPGKKGQPLSDMTLSAVLRRLGLVVTVHGFRSTFRDWCGEETNYPREIAEAALAHSVGDSTEQAYRRGDALAKRRDLMEAWSEFVEPIH